MIVTLRQMQYVCAVAETQSFSKAAELCFADQSTVSQQIKQFEEKLNIKIFNRETIPLKVTQEGQEVIEKCKSILNGVEELIKPIKKDIQRFQ